MLVTERLSDNRDNKKAGIIALQIDTEPQIHGIARSTPRNLFELHRLLETANINLLEFIDSKLDELKEANHLTAKIILIVNLPKKRKFDDNIEAIEQRAFFIAEDASRKIPLDQLEMQYYRFLIQKSELHNHLSSPNARYRYASTCSDISSRLPQDSIALLSAIASNALEKAMMSENALIQIWNSSLDDYRLNFYESDVSTMELIKQNEWTLCVDSFFMKKVHAERKNKLPNETGGVLIGSYDMSRKMIYIVDCIFSPADSEERPFFYTRGHKSLSKKVDEIRKITSDYLTYVGEWHSHPDGCKCVPSKADKDAFLWQAKEMAKSDFPAIMLIAGDNNSHANAPTAAPV
ncbi:MAG: Mov34/MPN/PAD-1 family protein [Chitinispirillia bacterium]|nr:Mov34/MPN/PAD-1 family protein [Chitinispirillia bacterium]